MLNVLHALFHLIFVTALWDVQFCYSHFAVEETEALKEVKPLVQSCTARQ